MNLEIRWSGPALLSLAEVLEYTATEHNIKQAEKMRRQVMDAIQRLSEIPYLAPIEPCSDLVGREVRGLKVIPRIKIIYSIIDDKIYIEYIKNTYLSDKTMLERMGYSL